MSSARPEFIRLPEDGETCPYTGFKRGSLRNLCIPNEANNFKPAVPAKSLRQPGNLRGIWLIPYAPLIAYINSLPTPGLANDSGATSGSPAVEAGPAAGAKASAARSRTKARRA